MPPLSASSPTTLLLQRRRSGSDCGKWRTVLHCTPRQLDGVTSWVAAARVIDSAVDWRLTTFDGQHLALDEAFVHSAQSDSVR